MRQLKAVEGVTVDECRSFIRICMMIVGVFSVWCVLYMPMRSYGLHAPLPEHLVWMVRQRDMANYVLPDNDTAILMPPGQCNGSVFLAVVVCSAVNNVAERNAIRDTWARDAVRLRSIRFYFLLGVSSNQSLNNAVYDESNKFGDIIQQDFIDSYNNLTIKSVMMLKWVGEHCSNAKYVLKTDDDMFVHLPNLFRFLKTKGHPKLLIGYLVTGAKPVKDRNSKWYAPDVLFPGTVYPPYLSGTAYVLSRDVVPILFQTALETPFFYVEDVFVTGICASKAGFEPINYEGFNLFYDSKMDVCKFRFIITVHNLSPKELSQVWVNLHNPSLKCLS